jgi:hypothetical protein
MVLHERPAARPRYLGWLWFLLCDYDYEVNTGTRKARARIKASARQKQFYKVRLHTLVDF